MRTQKGRPHQDRRGRPFSLIPGRAAATKKPRRALMQRSERPKAARDVLASSPESARGPDGQRSVSSKPAPVGPLPLTRHDDRTQQAHPCLPGIEPFLFFKQYPRTQLRARRKIRERGGRNSFENDRICGATIRFEGGRAPGTPLTYVAFSHPSILSFRKYFALHRNRARSQHLSRLRVYCVARPARFSMSSSLRPKDAGGRLPARGVQRLAAGTYPCEGIRMCRGSARTVVER
jgi:hypothetical protein